jgi:hypothetical protein
MDLLKLSFRTLSLPFFSLVTLLSSITAQPSLAFTYNLSTTLIADSQTVATAEGLITTDSSLGVLAPANFVDWNIQMKTYYSYYDPMAGLIRDSIVLTPNNSNVSYPEGTSDRLKGGNIQLIATDSQIVSIETEPVKNPAFGFRFASLNGNYAGYDIWGFDYSTYASDHQHCPPVLYQTADCLSVSISINGLGYANYFPDIPDGFLVASAVPEPSTILASITSIFMIGLGNFFRKRNE